MEKLIIITGNSNCGKTQSVNKAFKIMLEKYKYSIIKIFYNDKKIENDERGHAIIVEKNEKKIAFISFGDLAKDIFEIFNQKDINDCNIVVCCCRAAVKKQSFQALHRIVKENNYYSDVEIIPIHKNLLSGYGNNDFENEKTANLIVEMINNL